MRLKPSQTKWMVVSSVALALAPKCPFCLLAFFGTFGATAAIAPFYEAWLSPLTAIWLILTVGVLAWPRGGQTRYGPLLLGLAAGLAVFGGKFIGDNPRMVYAGIAALFGAAVWRAWRRPPAARELCARCTGSPSPRDVEPEMKPIVTITNPR